MVGISKLDLPTSGEYALQLSCTIRKNGRSIVILSFHQFLMATKMVLITRPVAS